MKKKIFIWCDKKDSQAFLDDGWRISLPKKQFINNEDEYILLYKMEDTNEK